jgi:serine/threonine protein kinase
MLELLASSPFNLQLHSLWAVVSAGTGTFGRVYLVRHKETGKFYALKVLRKMDVVRLKQVDHIKNEKNILLELNHPFIVTLYVIATCCRLPPSLATRLIFPLSCSPVCSSSFSFWYVLCVWHGCAATRRGKMRRICTC